MKRRKGFTLIELLVVVAIIALLVSILLPALGRARELAKRIVCSSQLAGIGRSIALYLNDYEDDYPTIHTGQPATAGYVVYGGGRYNAPGDMTVADPAGPKDRWCDPEWKTLDYDEWKDPDNWPTAWREVPTVGGCMYLLIKLEDLVPEMFRCPSADNDVEMDMSGVAALAAYSGMINSWRDLRDFSTARNMSYSMHDPFGNFRANGSAQSDLAVLADQNPAYDTDGGSTDTAITTAALDIDTLKDQLNSKNHGGDIQNVLHVGSNVSKEDSPDCGISNDNIYTRWDDGASDDETKKSVGEFPTTADVDNLAADSADCFLGS